MVSGRHFEGELRTDADGGNAADNEDAGDDDEVVVAAVAADL